VPARNKMVKAKKTMRERVMLILYVPPQLQPCKQCVRFDSGEESDPSCRLMKNTVGIGQGVRKLCSLQMRETDDRCRSDELA
jgi:hypothetical protein